jgi:asparagine synthase (glutamine-hydrolysing)
MCGFLGIINHKSLDKKLFKTSLDLIDHRGPDKSTIYVDSKICFGFNRLSIRDLTSSGDQPMHSAQKCSTLMFNGEIYNYSYLVGLLKRHNVKLKSNSDTEVVLELYNIFGIQKTLELVEGMFALAIYDKKIKKVFLARDRFCQKPLFFHKNKDGFIFASEIKSIIKYIGNVEFDKINILNPLFTTGLPPRSKTCFNKICTLNPGELMTYNLDSTEFKIQDYFNVEMLVDEKMYNDLSSSSTKNLVHRYNDLLHESVKLHLQSDAPIASLLSFGLDSSLISAIASQYSDINHYHFKSNKDNTYTYSEHYKKNFKSHIVNIHESSANLTGDLVKMIYHYETSNKEEGVALSKLCSRSFDDGIKVLLTGDCADELFGGYAHHLTFLCQSMNFNSFVKRKFTKGIRKFLPSNILNMPECNPLGFSYNSAPALRNLEEVPMNFLYHRGERLIEWKRRIQAYDFISNPTERAMSAFLLDEIGYRLQRFLIRGDRFGMMNSTELRNPFLYTPLVKLAVNTPNKFKIKRNFKGGYEQKYILKEVAKLNGVPKSIIYRKKVGTPIDSGSDINKILDNLNFEATTELLNIKRDKIKYALFNSYDEGISRLKYSFFSIEVLHQLFICGRSYNDITDEFNSYLS